MTQFPSNNSSNLVRSGSPASLRLGSIVSIYEANAWGRQKWILGGSVMLAVAIMGFAMPHLRPPKPGEERFVFGFFYIAGGLNAVIGTTLLIDGWFTSPRRFVIHQGGFVVDDGKSQLEVPWQDIVHMRIRFEEDPQLASLGFGKFVDVIEICGGKNIEIEFDQVQNSQDLVATIGQTIANERAPAVIAAIRRGEAVAFGPITLSAEGVKVDDQFVRYADLEGFVSRPTRRIRILLRRDSEDEDYGVIWTKHHCDEVPDWAIVARVVEALGQP